MSEKISIQEHMMRTQMHMDNIMEMSMDVLPKLADTMNKIKLRKAMKKLAEPTVKEEEKDWQECTEQGIGVSSVFGLGEVAEPKAK